VRHAGDRLKSLSDLFHRPSVEVLELAEARLELEAATQADA
jgi:hypothetical protein